MVLDTQRDNVDPLVTRIAKHFTFVHPNVLSFLSLIFAIIAAMFFYFSTPENYFLYFASLFVFANGFFDAIDGKVAKLTNTVSKKGDFIDHAIDRYADVFMVGGLALSIWCDPTIGFFAIVGMLLTSYMGTQSQAIGHKREYSGLLGRADRLVLLMIFPAIQQALFHYGIEKIYGFYLLCWVLVYFAVVGNITAVQRFYSTLGWFKNKK